MKEVKIVGMRNIAPSVIEVADAPVHMNNDELALAHLLNDGWNIEGFNTNATEKFIYLVLVRERQE